MKLLGSHRLGYMEKEDGVGRYVMVMTMTTTGI